MDEEAVEAAEAHRVETERRAEQIALLIITAIIGGEDTNEDQMRRLSELAAASAVASVLILIWMSLGFDGNAAKLRPGVSPASMLEQGPLREAIEDAVENTAQHLEETLGQVASEVSSVAPGMDQAQARTVARSLGTSLATEASSYAAMVLAPAIAAHLKTTMKKMWISRGDSRVRSTHRRLHAHTADMDAEFKPGLRYPGDPLAEFDERVNCRCGMFLVPEQESAEAEEALELDESQFNSPLAASGARAANTDIVERHPIADALLGGHHGRNAEQPG